MIGSIMTF